MSDVPRNGGEKSYNIIDHFVQESFLLLLSQRKFQYSFLDFSEKIRIMKIMKDVYLTGFTMGTP